MSICVVVVEAHKAELVCFESDPRECPRLMATLTQTLFAFGQFDFILLDH